MKPHTVYLSGPMTGLPNLNKEEFDKVANLIAKVTGHKVIVPHTTTEGLDLHPINDYKKALREAMKALINEADELVMLPQSEFSFGATAEALLARQLDIPVTPVAAYFKKHGHVLPVGVQE